MRNSSLTHLLNPEALYSSLTHSLFRQFFTVPILSLDGFTGASEFSHSSISRSTSFRTISALLHTKNRIKRKAPLLLAFLTIFCFGMGLGIQKIFPNNEISDVKTVIDSGQSRLGACKITEDQVSLNLLLHSSPRIKILIKQFGGETVYRRDVNLGRQKKLDMDIDLKVFPKGIYMLKVESGDQQMVRLITRS